MNTSKVTYSILRGEELSHMYRYPWIRKYIAV